VNEEGFLFICDRKVDMIITGGMNIYSAEIERVLVQHPKVADCAVFGVPDELMGEVVHAVVQPLPDVMPDAQLTADVLKFMGFHLSSAKVPRRVEFTNELPRDPNGKLYKHRLRDPYWEHLGRRI
jgi:long-chain acyl-CoA synthetase